MKIKTKLTYGIGILFILILILGVVAGKYITDMSTDTRNILADNYQSLSYARQMLYSLENIGKDTAAVNVFIDNLRKQQNNITEKDEAEVTTRLMMHFEQFKKDTGQLVVRQLRQDLNDIIQVNMHSIYHKSEIAGRTATNALLWIYVVGIVCVVIALGILMVFPGSITRPIRELVTPADSREPLKIYADNKESYFQAQYIPLFIQPQDRLMNTIDNPFDIFFSRENIRQYTLPVFGQFSSHIIK